MDPIHEWIRQSRWRGILVEPQLIEFEKLKTNYRQEQNRLVFENVAIATTDGTCTLYRIENGGTEDWERGVASLLTEPLRFATGRFIAETVPCITFDTLLRRHHVSRIDLLQIDTEGYDFEILKQIDFSRLRPVMIRYEHRHLKARDRLACRTYLKGFGYRILEMRFDTAAV
jgi:FkbM family methyltransferase